jgi:hypothetical protein
MQWKLAGILVILAGMGMHDVRAMELPPYPRQAHVIQRLRAFDNPEGSIFSADGRYVFIANSAELGMPDKGFHWTHNGGYISKLEVQPDGTLKMLNERLITGLTGPLGMVVNTVATKKFPKGTIFLCEAWLALAEADGTEVTDPKVVDPVIIGFNTDGKVLGRIRIGAGSAAAKASGVVATLANSLAMDREGNLYLADTGVHDHQFKPRIEAHGGGVYMFPHTSLDVLADDGDAPVRYIPTPEGGPDGIEVAPDNSIHFNTVGLNADMKDPAEGGMYRLQKADFANKHLPAPFIRGVGALDGLQFAAGKRLDTEVKNTNSVTVTPLPGHKVYRLTYDQDIALAGPADIAVRKMPDGTYLLVIPELAATSPNHKDNTVTVVRLPADF